MSPTTQPVLTEIRDADFKTGYVSPLTINDYDVRRCARGPLVRDGKIALLYVSKWHYHKLPGGGIEDGEDIATGFNREILEETGCNCVVQSEEAKTPVIIEYRDEFKLCQINHLIAATVVGEPKKVAFTGDEIEEGFQLKWVPIAEAIPLLENDKPTNYEGLFIQKRDLAILKYFADLLNRFK
ncbi:MAG: NUDIX domain-containing protein [Patescibacteria group bacterium]